MPYSPNLLREINGLNKRLHKLEAVKQSIGADIVQVTTSSLASGNSGTIGAGESVVFTITLTPSSEILTLWDLFFSFYIDTDDNTSYLYPSGSSLTDAQKDLDVQFSLDWASSNDTTGKRVGKVVIINNDSSSHTYYLYARWYGIKQDV